LLLGTRKPAILILNLLNNGKEIKWSEIHGNSFYCGKIVHEHTKTEYGALGRVAIYPYIMNYSKIIQERPQFKNEPGGLL
jgi:hypothetical protein